MNKLVRYWLMKSEPEVFSITDLESQKKTLWEGVRNYQARNFMMKDMKAGDQILFYHSNANPSGIAGLAEVVSLAQPDPTALNKKSEYFDPKATKENPIWFCVEVKFVEKFNKIISLENIRGEKKLKDMLLLRKGQRLSVQPVTKEEFEIIKNMKR